jgi:hypothetical protein
VARERETGEMTGEKSLDRETVTMSDEMKRLVDWREVPERPRLEPCAALCAAAQRCVQAAVICRRGDAAAREPQAQKAAERLSLVRSLKAQKYLRRATPLVPAPVRERERGREIEIKQTH